MIYQNKKAYIFDLDNTIYPVSSIADELFAPLFQLLRENDVTETQLAAIRDGVMRKPFHVVAETNGLAAELTEKATDLLKNVTYDGEIQSFADYSTTKAWQGVKFLVTMGFSKLQWSKIRKLDLEKDLTTVYVVDPSVSSKKKKDIFLEILDKWKLVPNEVLIIGDDPDSEIKAGRELGVDSVLYDKESRYEKSNDPSRITDYNEIKFE